jgi:hypothetical protein
MTVGTFTPSRGGAKWEIGSDYFLDRTSGADCAQFAEGQFVPSPDISILLFYTHEQFPPQRAANPEENICCFFLMPSSG